MTIDDTYRNRWIGLFCEISNPAPAAEVYHRIRECYGEGHRHYHTFDHVIDCLEHLDLVREDLDDPIAMELAFWFHDVIYKPMSRSNETDSAQFARSRLRPLDVAEQRVSAVQHLILLTKHPTIPQGNDEKYLLDIDLAIFGDTEERFNAYERNIRIEYKWVPGFMFRRKRAKLLQRILSKKFIYHSPRFREEREAIARENLSRSLAALV